MDAVIEQINSAGKAFVDFAWPMLVQSGVLIAILLLADFLLHKNVRAVFRYWLWMLVFIKLVLPTTLSSPMSVGRIIGEPVASVRIAVPEQPVGGNISDTQPPLPPAESAAVSQVDLSPAAPIRSQPIAPAASLTWQGGVLLVWLAVVITMFLLLLQRAVFVCGLVRQSAEVNGLMNDTLRFCCKLMGVKQTIGLKVSPNATSPAVCGLFRPVILVPQGLGSNLGISSLRVVLMHELAHIKRGDLWVNLIQTLLQIAYFYNPLLWLANWTIRRVREQAVDEAVQVALGDKANQYPETLLNVARLAFERPALSLRLVGVVESKSALSSRIKRMLTRPIPKTAKLGIISSLTIILLAAGLLPMAKAEKPAESKAAQADNNFAATLLKAQTQGPLPNIYIMGPGSSFEKIVSVVRDWTSNKTGRNHDKNYYDQIFIDGIWSRKAGDLIVLIFSLDTSYRIPSEYADLLPEPWSEIEASLKQGNIVEAAGKARGMNVIVLAAPRMEQIGEVIAESKYLHNPKQFVGSISRVCDPGIEDFNIRPYPEGGLYTVTVSIKNKGSSKSPEFRVYFYRNDPNRLNPMTHGAGPIEPGGVWNEMSMPFALQEGTNDIAVLLDPDNTIGEFNRTNNEASMKVVVKDGKIAAVEKKVSPSSATAPAGKKVVGIGPGWWRLERVIGDNYGGSIGGYSNDEQKCGEYFEKVLSWARPGDTFLMMFAFDEEKFGHSQMVPKEYQDLLPKPWKEIKEQINRGEVLELKGKARGLDTIVLAAPTLDQLDEIIKSTELLQSFKTSAGQNEAKAVEAAGGVDITPAGFDILLDRERGDCSLVVSIRNDSEVTIPKFKLNFYRGDPADNLDETGKWHGGWHEAGPIEPGKSWNEGTRYFKLPDGEYEFNVILNINDSVAEADKSNNRASMKVVVKDGKIVEKKASFSSAKDSDKQATGLSELVISAAEER